MKRILTILLVLAMVLICTACGTPVVTETQVEEELAIEPTSEGSGLTQMGALDISYTSRGVEVNATVTIPDAESYPLVVMCHGHGGSKEENGGFTAIADALAESGIATIRMDYPGCGTSTEPFTQNTLSNMIADTSAGIDYMEANYNVTSLGIFGYSMGGRIALEMIKVGDYDFSAVTFLAPAADLENLKNFFGGSENWDVLKATAEQDGNVEFTTVYGATQDLSKGFFEDMENGAGTIIEDAQAAYGDRPSLVIYAKDDTAVDPSVSQAVASAFKADIAVTPKDGHSYGFYSDEAEVLDIVVNSTNEFFTLNLINNGEQVVPVSGGSSEDILYTSRGVEVNATVTIPDAESYPLVVMCHGHGGSKEENGGFTAIADALAESGIATIRMDYPGCGTSTEPFTQNTLSNMIADTSAGIDYMEANYNVTSLGIFGYSMGGRIALEMIKVGDYDFSAVTFLAPAADLENLKNFFGGSENWDVLKATAEQDGNVEFTTVYGATQDLSKGFFEDMENGAGTIIEDAQAAYGDRPSLVIYAKDDTAVDPSVSQAVASAFKADIAVTPKDGHSYGFYSDEIQVLYKVVNSVKAFFDKSLAA